MSHRTGSLSLSRLLPDFRHRPYFRFIERRSGPFDGSALLSRDRIYIIPTRAGLIFALLLLLLLAGSINYEKSLGFILTFLLAGIGIVSLLATWRNLEGLKVTAENSQPVFAGEPAVFSLLLHNGKALPRLAIGLDYQGQTQDWANCEANGRVLMRFRAVSERRGLLQAGRFRLFSEFPGGLFVAWTWLDLSQTCLVYPAPDTRALLPAGSYDDSGDNEFQGQGTEHFSHLAKYQAGDKINRISWKAAARTDELFSKCFTGATLQTTWIRWQDIAARDDEQRLSIMTARIIHAENRQQPYGITLPGREIGPGLGKAHYHRCLRELALF